MATGRICGHLFYSRWANSLHVLVLAKRQFTHIHLQIACCKMLWGRRSSEIGENTTQVRLSLKASLFEEEIYSVEVWHPSKMLRLQ